MNEQDRAQLEIVRLGIINEINKVGADVREIKNIVSDHEERIRSTERWKLSIPISVVVAIVAILSQAFKR